MPAFDSDIVAVHGLNGHPVITCTHSNESHWLRNFLPLSLPTARVYTFGYSSEVAFSRSRASVDQFARMLLNALCHARPSQVRQPIRVDLGAPNMESVIVEG